MITLEQAFQGLSLTPHQSYVLGAIIICIFADEEMEAWSG